MVMWGGCWWQCGVVVSGNVGKLLVAMWGG